MYVAQSTLNHFILHYFEFLNHVCLLHIVYKFTSDDSCGSYSEIQPHLKIGIIKCISTLSKYHRAISKFKKSAILHSMKDHPNSSKTFICFLRADFHNEVSSFSWCLIGTFPWRNCSVRNCINIKIIRVSKYIQIFPSMLNYQSLNRALPD